jgi:hypothetical protein
MLKAMGWLRRTFLAGGLGASGLIAMAIASCASPTQIVVEVYSDACPSPGRPKRLNTTNIYVGKSADIDTRPPSAVRDGCETVTGIGSLTVYPSGDRDEEVAIKVVTGIDASPNLCAAPGHAGCIAQTRVMRFVPNTTQRMIVKLALACLDRTCPVGTTCDDGVCKLEGDVLVDGGTRENAPTTEAGVPADASVDAGPADPCTGCAGDCTGGVCRVDCSKVSCNAGAELCAPNLRCEITCPTTGSCDDARCTTTDTCVVMCGEKKSSCTKVACNAQNCDVRCTGTEACRTGGGGISLDAGAKGSLVCRGDNACDRASCNAPTCELGCSPYGGPKAACPPPGARPCTGGCVQWNTPVDVSN